MQANIAAAVRRRDIEFHPDPETDRVIVTDGRSGRQFRLTRDAVSVLNLLDGRHNSIEIARSLSGSAESAEDIKLAVERLVSIGLATAPQLAGGRHRALHGRHRAPEVQRQSVRERVASHIASLSRPGRAVRFNPPAAVEFSFGSPHRLLGKLTWLGDWLARPLVQVCVVGFTVSGAAAFAASWPNIHHALSQPITSWGLLIVLVSTLLTTAVHELAHGVLLRRNGGRVRRMGFMLLYGSPALFCDVSDAWRLPRRKRVAVALAGVRLHAFAAATAGWLLLAIPGQTLATTQILSLVGVADFAMAVINLLPFVKFDGYIALVGWKDIPHLRMKSMQLAGAAAGSLVFGRGTKPQPKHELSGLRWAAFGIACALCPPVLVGIAVLDYGPLAVAILGSVGAAVLLMVLLALLYLPARSIGGAITSAQRRGVPFWRRAAGVMLVVLAMSSTMSLIQVPAQRTAVFGASGSAATGSAAYLVMLSGSPPKGGTAVTLERAGVLFHPVVAHASVCGPARVRQVTAGIGSPVTSGLTSRARVSVPAVPLCVLSGPVPTSGIAIVSLGATNLYGWLEATFIQPYIQQLGL